MHRAHAISFDQFYTTDACALNCYNKFAELYAPDQFDIILEPSAGRGAFYKLLPENKRIGLDIEPLCEGIQTMNFFDFVPTEGIKYAVIGNPPFGRVSSEAIRFFNHSAKFAEIISFILPRTFKRVSIQNQLDMRFDLEYCEDLPLKPCCFTPRMGAKCVFQIWKRARHLREPVVFPKYHPDFHFLEFGPKDKNDQPTPPDDADFALKAYGSHCGTIVTTDLGNLRPKSWHWIKSNMDKDILINKFRTLDYSISMDTVRQDSIGRGELIFLYHSKYDPNA